MASARRSSASFKVDSKNSGTPCNVSVIAGICIVRLHPQPTSSQLNIFSHFFAYKNAIKLIILLLKG